MWPAVAKLQQQQNWAMSLFFWNQSKNFLIRLNWSTFVCTRQVTRLHSSTLV